jgi:hypothetical protein
MRTALAAPDDPRRTVLLWRLRWFLSWLREVRA